LLWIWAIAALGSFGTGLFLARRLARQLASAISGICESTSRLALGIPTTKAAMRFRETEAFDTALARVAELLFERTLARDRAITAQEGEQRERERLEYLAAHDPLTGLLNRRGFDALLAERVSACRQYGHQLAVLYVDMDGFKRINDDLGHAVGDELLRCFAARLTAGVRATDTVARLGGDEFGMILDHANLVQAVSAADALIDQLSRPYRIQDVRLEVSASIGIAVNLDAGNSPRSLLEAADPAMYRAKNAGKARYATSDFGLLAA
jgi:diguanylate cyclase (GGDEF)-like protein